MLAMPEGHDQRLHAEDADADAVDQPDDEADEQRDAAIAVAVPRDACPAMT